VLELPNSVTQLGGLEIMVAQVARDGALLEERVPYYGNSRPTEW